jgi:hypothetical protein
VLLVLLTVSKNLEQHEVFWKLVMVPLSVIDPSVRLLVRVVALNVDRTVGLMP